MSLDCTRKYYVTQCEISLHQNKAAAIDEIILGVCHYKDCSQLENLLFMKNNAVYIDQPLTDGLACIKYDSVFSAPVTLISLFIFYSIFVPFNIF